jgi:hypothetical protein
MLMFFSEQNINFLIVLKDGKEQQRRTKRSLEKVMAIQS